jgi:hypothetical protein
MKQVWLYLAIFMANMFFPLIFSSIIWVITLGSFDFVAWCRSGDFVGFNAMWGFVNLFLSWYCHDKYYGKA